MSFPYRGVGMRETDIIHFYSEGLASASQAFCVA